MNFEGGVGSFPKKFMEQKEPINHQYTWRNTIALIIIIFISISSIKA